MAFALLRIDLGLWMLPLFGSSGLELLHGFSIFQTNLCRSVVCSLTKTPITIHTYPSSPPAASLSEKRINYKPRARNRNPPEYC